MSVSAPTGRSGRRTLNPNQTIAGYRIDSRDKKAVKQSKELDYLLPKKGSQESLDALTEAVDEDNKLDTPQRNCYGKEDTYRDYDNPRNLAGVPTDFEAKLACTGCPLLELCSDYAEKARPAFGIWAGKLYGRDLIFE